MHPRLSDAVPRTCREGKHSIQSIVLEFHGGVFQPSLWTKFQGFIEIPSGVVRR